MLLVSSEEKAQEELRDIFQKTKWALRRVSSYEETAKELKKDPPSVVICEEELEDGKWQDILVLVEECGSPLIVAAAYNDDVVNNGHLWSEVLNLGGYDVLARPLDNEEVFRIVAGAWRYWREKKKREQEQ